jgi:hypothetical protein
MNEDDESLRFEITEDSFSVKGRVPITRKQVLLIMLAILTACGMAPEQIRQIMTILSGGMI